MFADPLADRVRDDSCPVERVFERSGGPALFPDRYQINLAFELNVLEACGDVLAPELMAFMTFRFCSGSLLPGLQPCVNIPIESCRKK